MDAKHILVLAIQLSIVVSVFGFGLKTSVAELKHLYSEAGLFLRSLLAVFVLMPVVAVLLVQTFDLRRPVEIILIALAISPSPPLLPRKQIKAGGHRGYGVDLMALLALASIVMVPAGLWFLQQYTGRDLSVAPGTIANIVLTSILLPLAAGMLCRRLLPRVADSIAVPLALIGNVLLGLAAIALIVGTAPSIWALIGQGTLFAMSLFTIVGLAIGHFLALPDRDHSVVLALSTSCRHPAIAIAVAAANFPHEQFAPAVLLYLLVSGIVGIPYVRWQVRRATATPQQ